MEASRQRASELREVLIQTLDQASSLELRLSEDDSAYGLTYIGQKLAKCASYLEQLGDISMSLTRISLEVTRQVSELGSRMKSKERQLRSDPAYVNGSRDEKTPWLQGKLEVFRIELEEWELTRSYLSEIRDVVNERIQLFKRLDSDIRLQHKLLEAKVLAGAMPASLVPGVPGGVPGGSTGGMDELEID